MSHIELLKEISVRGLKTVLLDRVKVVRPFISRNTVDLAFKHGPTTPLREYILKTAQEMIDEQVKLEGLITS